MTMYRLTTAVILLALSGCIAQLTVAEKAPHASYDVGDVIAISVVDERYKLRSYANERTVGGTQNLGYIPVFSGYGVCQPSKSRPAVTLAEDLEGCLVLGLSDSGWRVKRAGLDKRPAKPDISSVLWRLGADKFLLLVLNDWWVTERPHPESMVFDWEVLLWIYDFDGNPLLQKRLGFSDRIAKFHYSNHKKIISASKLPPQIRRMAFRERLEWILEEPDVKNTLLQGAPEEPHSRGPVDVIN
jgi:hypothetical protein